MDLPSPPPQPAPPFPFSNSTTTIPSFTAPNYAYPTAFSAPISTTNTLFTAPIEAQNHVTQSPVANPTPTTTTTQHHPPYAEMIYSAIAALKERNGSSKRAIAKYIEAVYSNLPPTHSALLTHHLKRLKNNGHLLMVKKSYKLPRSDSFSTTTSPPAAAAATTHSITLSGSGRGRGRPPKSKPIPQPTTIAQPFSSQSTSIQGFTQASAQPTDVQAFIQPTNFQSMAQQTAQPNTQPMFVALGLVDDPNNLSSEKRRPGRPRKVVGAGLVQAGPSFVKRGRGRPIGSMGKPRFPKMSPGRPRKPKSVLTAMGPKRGRGRPYKAEPKTMIIPQYATNMAMVTVDPNSVVVVQQQPISRTRGRPRKAMVPNGGVLSGKRRGRPPKIAVVTKSNKRSLRPLGRPRKNGPTPLSETSHQLFAANGDLKRKLDYFQSKVKDAVDMLKPHITHESAVNTIAAIQELEELVTMDMSAPLREEAQTARQATDEPQPPLPEQPQFLQLQS